MTLSLLITPVPAGAPLFISLLSLGFGELVVSARSAGRERKSRPKYHSTLHVANCLAGSVISFTCWWLVLGFFSLTTPLRYDLFACAECQLEEPQNLATLVKCHHQQRSGSNIQHPGRPPFSSRIRQYVEAWTSISG